jgi:hypothetical protein
VMYVTAHVVRASRFDGRRGVNAFSHLVTTALDDAISVSATFELIAQDAGRLAGCFIELPPGGNEVESYLDLLVPEQSQVEAALQEARLKIVDSASLPNPPLHIEASIQHGMFRFSGAEGWEPLAVFEQLKDSALRASREAQAPLRIYTTQEMAEDGGEVLFFRLEPPTAERLRKIHGSDWRALPVGVHEDVHHQFVDTHGPLMPRIIEVLTGLSEKDIEGLGGLVVVSPSGEISRPVPAAQWLAEVEA